MGVVLALSTIQSLIEVLPALETFPFFDHVEDFKLNFTNIKDFFHEVETSRGLSAEAERWIEELKDAVYEADNVLDEIVTSVNQKRRMTMTFQEAVRQFFSRDNLIAHGYRVSERVKGIHKKIDGIFCDLNNYQISFNPQPIRSRREEICSYVYDNNIIGRDSDLEGLVSILLDKSNVKQDVSFLSIVGIGGLGKTTLAHLVFNDTRVRKAFSDDNSTSFNGWWACVSDADSALFDVNLILRNILNYEGSSMDSMEQKFVELIINKKFLLVLDDVWTECPDDWLKLEKLLLGGRRGSWVVITTRSQKTASIIGCGLTYELKGLSMEDSWKLFANMAFEPGKEDSYDQDFVHIGRQIADQCCSLPLALRVVGSLLYGQDKTTWLSIHEMITTFARENADVIIPILKISYHNLDPSIKSCFCYCALFPKDFLLKKDILIRLWMAQGFIVPLGEGQSIEDVAEEYFSILLRRCFFQDAQKDVHGEIFACKMHDLMHDLAQMETCNEIRICNCISDSIGENCRHLAHRGTQATNCSFTNKTILRSYLKVDYQADVKMDQNNLEALIEKIPVVRALDLSNADVRYLPSTIGKLLHLRYLNLSWLEQLEELPESIKRLYNLQTLMLQNCDKLLLLNGISELVSLRVLDIWGCNSLTCMPFDIGKLTGLRVLSISDCNSLTCIPCNICELTALRVLTISNCQSLTRMPSDIGMLTKLRILSISDCNSLTMPSDVGTLTKLRVLNIRNCNSLTCIPRNICKLTELRVLTPEYQ